MSFKTAEISNICTNVCMYTHEHIYIHTCKKTKKKNMET
jgi:hypothetical protein